MNLRQLAQPLWSIDRCILFALTLAVSLPIGAQYTTPGMPIPTRHNPSKAEFQERLEQSPWKAGPLALNPWLRLRDVSIVTDLNTQGTDQGDDLTATVGAGLRGYLPAGTKALFAAHALPEYVWWQDQEDKRRFNGRYGLGLFVFFNRLSLELSQRRIEQQSFFSSEIQVLTSSRSDVSTFSLELEVAPNLSLFGIGKLRDYRSEDDDPTFASLDREDESGLISARYENPRGWIFELGFLGSSSDFAEGARNLSNSGTAVQTSIGLSRSKIEFLLDLSFEDREADQGSDFGRFNDTTGNVAVLWKPSQGINVLGYARRGQAYSTDDRFTFFLEERQGGRCNFNLDHVTFGLFGETGEDEFERTSPGLPHRLDDVTAYGADLRVSFREVSFSVRATRSDYDSGLDEFDRDVTRLEFSLELEAITRFTSRLIDKLSLGSAGPAW